MYQLTQAGLKVVVTWPQGLCYSFTHLLKYLESTFYVLRFV